MTVAVMADATADALSDCATILWLKDDNAVLRPELIARLAPDEQAVFAAMPAASNRQRGFLFSRLMLRQLLSAHIPPEEIQFQRTDSGSLRLAGDTGWQISLSHTVGGVAVIICPRACGIDIEIPRAVTLDKVVARYFSASERAAFTATPGNLRADLFFRLWTLKEACVKALGQGLAGNLARLAFDVAGDVPRARQSTPKLQLWQQFVAPYYLAAVVKGDAPVKWQVQQIVAAEL